MTPPKAAWPDGVDQLARDLHSRLTINEKDWHKFKGNSDRRAAELLAGALLQLLQDGHSEDIEALINQGVLWVRGELKDPGCPRH